MVETERIDDTRHANSPQNQIKDLNIGNDQSQQQHIFDRNNQAELINKKEGLPVVKLSDFKAIQIVGSGTFGTVYKAIYNNDAT